MPRNSSSYSAFHFVPFAAEVAPAAAFPPTALTAVAPTIALTICAVPGDLLDLADDRLIDSCANGTRSKVSSCDLAHDAAAIFLQ